ncbi:biotin--[acetyl-CoA-carboxylase] ligase [Salinibacillus xinjiangensis]|uniref:Bifunctional ligase/repressor BirA n=2 Tax=Salinibacillus xinjiangensis TaxID=1229268 RepID=A0A6G1X625_9BACI|nr:biotin--[acetyl-CoA-carboxylase] ligase [Salinibacillus xinjiangensis]
MESTRKRLITLLAKKKDEYISGQKLSDELNISRAAIWKQMKSLENEGYQIEAVSRKGYRIVRFPERMSVNTIQWNLKTDWLGQNMHFEEQVDSTQTVAHQLAREGAEHGTVIVADEQLKGRGRLHRPWHSQKGSGIWMSIILRPDIEPHRAPQLTLASAVAITKMLKFLTGVQPKIKWPNDIFVGDRKLAGILTEMQAEQDLIEYVIIGIGLNVNLDQKAVPDDLQDVATSIQLETGKAWKREELIQELLYQMESIYELFLQQGFSSIKQAWEQDAYRLGETITVKARRKEWEATLIGIHEDGALIVEDENQSKSVLYSAEIDWKKGE